MCSMFETDAQKMRLEILLTVVMLGEICGSAVELCIHRARDPSLSSCKDNEGRDW